MIKLKFLTEDQEQKRLCEMYWELSPSGKFTHKVADLSKYFDLSASKIHEEVSKCCIAISTDIKYSCCGSSCKLTNRSDFQWKKSYTQLVCAECKAKEEMRIKAEQSQGIKDHRAFLYSLYGYEKRGPYNPRDFSLENAFYLFSVVHAAAENFKFLFPFEAIIGKLSSNADFEEEILLHLFNEKLIFVHPESTFEAFDEDGSVIDFSKVMWNLPFGRTSEDPRKIIEEIEELFRPEHIIQEWKDDFVTLWKKIVFNESLACLKEKLQEVGLGEVNVSESNKLAISQLLTDYSGGQIFWLIDQSMRRISELPSKRGFTKQHAANCLAKNIQWCIEKAQKDGFPIQSIDPLSQWQCSTLVKVFFEKIVGIGENGFKKAPTEKNLRELQIIEVA